jgi:hypothetical protein
VATVGSGLVYSDTGLTNGVTYYYQVSALNAFLVEGPRSQEVSATPVTVPSEPRSLQATPGNARVTVAWQAPASDGGAAVTGYRVYRGVGSGSLQLLRALGAVLTYEDVSAQNGVAYSYQVRAVNIAGEGPPSVKVSATPRAPPDTSRPMIAIDSPRDGAVLSAREVVVSGTASDDVGVSRVDVSVDGSTWVRANGTTTWSASLTLSEGANTIFARATDTSGNENTTSVSATVRLAGTAPGTPWGYVVLVAAAAVGAAAVALLVRRKRRREGPARPT